MDRHQPRRWRTHHFDPRAVLGLPAVAFAFNDEPGTGTGINAVPGNAQGAQPGQPGQPGQPLTLTSPPEGFVPQDQIDRIVQQRLQRERQQTDQRLAALGFADWDQLQQTLTATQQAEAERQRQAEEAQRQELERQQRWHELKQLDQRKHAEQMGTLQQQLDAERQQRELAQQRYQTERTQRELVSAATLSEAVHPTQVATLLERQVRLEEDGRLVVIDPTTGQVRTNGTGAEMTLPELTNEFLEKNPHFRRASAGTGANSAPAGGAPPVLSGDDIAAKLADPTWVRDNRVEAVELMKQQMRK